MLSENVPNCPFCDSHEFEGGGGHFGSGLNQQTFTCAGCGAFVQILGNRTGSLLAYIDRAVCTCDNHPEYPSWSYPKDYGERVNTVVLPTWRHHEEKREDHRKMEWSKWLDEVFYLEFPDLTDYQPHGKRTYYDLPDEAKAFIDKAFGGTTEPMRYGSYVPFPEELDAPVYPPQWPGLEGVHLFYMVDSAWDPVDPKLSMTLEAPEDPILRRNREFFDDVWVELAKGIEREMPPVAKTKNRYGGIEPWYAFQLGNAVFVVGWRKRVVRIGVEFENSFPTAEIKALADRDNVTYTAEGPLYTRTAEQLEELLQAESARQKKPYDPEFIADIVQANRENHPGGELTRDSATDTACKTIIHAWGKDKTIEYLTTLCRSILLEQSA